jgi:hypothetical protein
MMNCLFDGRNHDGRFATTSWRSHDVGFARMIKNDGIEFGCSSIKHQHIKDNTRANKQQMIYTICSNTRKEIMLIEIVIYYLEIYF